jgi:succinate dehydrogenase / fumarate reductase, flavoprotein subunit
MSNPVRLQTDVLVVGGGAAGARAAFEATAAGLSTILAVKGLLGKSGCSIFAGELAYITPAGEPLQTGESARPMMEALEDEVMTFYAKYTHYLGDQEYMKRAALYAQEEFLPWVESKGLYFLRDVDNEIVREKPHGMTAWAVRLGLSGSLIMDIMRKLILRDPRVHLLEEVMVTRLLTNAGEVVGACALDFVSGKFYVISAKVVILATGHSNYLSARSTGTREGAANGWVMAYMAGARLQNIEMQWYHVSDVSYPATWMRLHLYPNPLPATAQRSRLSNNRGEVFFDSNWFPNAVPYVMQLKHLIREVQAGRARFDGDYYSSYAHVEPAIIDKYMFQAPFGEKIGVDVKKDRIENAIGWHMNLGGIRVDGRTMESEVPGLLAAGSVNALITGSMHNVTYEGLLAAGTAATRIGSGSAFRPLDETQVNAEQERVFGLRRVSGGSGLSPGQVKKRIRATTWEKLHPIKSAASLQEAYEAYCRIEEEDVPRMRLQSDTDCFNSDWVDALDVVDMITALKLQTQFSLFRKESRGPFYREDFPYTDNVAWLAHVVGRRCADGELAIEKFPVDLPYAAPKERVADYFDVDY